MDSSAPVQVSPSERDTLDELERKSFRRDGGWVPVGEFSHQVELGRLVDLGLVELREPDAHEEQAVPCCRRVSGVGFIVVLPRQDSLTRRTGSCCPAERPSSASPDWSVR
jgi:hypothetical protein